MANKSVLELAVGTGQWDAGLRKAKQSLDNFTQANGGLQQALQKESANMQKFVQMMGKMDSSAKTAKGQMSDYKSTIEQLTMQYNRMSEAQKQTIGQDYLNAIDSLRQKYQAVNEELQEMNRALSNTKAPDLGNAGGGGGPLGGNLSDMISVFGGNMMTKGAELGMNALRELGNQMVDTTKQAMEMSVQSEGIRLAFERLNRPGLLDNLREATHGTVNDLQLMQAAVKFEDFGLPLEELGTMLAFAQQKAKDTGQSVDYLVDSIVTGLGRQSTMILDNLGLSQTEVKERTKETGDMTVAVGQIIREQMQAAGDYVETASDRALKANAEYENSLVELGDRMRETFNIGSMDEVNMYLKNELVQTMLFTVDIIDRAKDAIHSLTGPMEDALVKMDEIGKNNGFVNFMNKVISLEGPLINVRGLLHDINSLVGGSGGGSVGSAMRKVSGFIEDARTQENRKKYGYYEVTTDKSGKVLSATQHKANGDTVDYTDFERKRRNQSTTPTTTGGRGGRGGRGGGGRGTTPEKELTIQQQIAKLEKEALTATDERRAEIAKTVQELDKVLEKQKKITEELHKGKEVKTEYEGKGVFTGMPESTDFADSDTRSPSERMRDSVLAAMSDKAMAVDEETMRTLMQTAIENGIDGIDWDTINEMMWEGMNVPDDVWKNIQTQINEKLQELGVAPLDIDFSTGKKKKEKKDDKKDDDSVGKDVSKIMNSVGSIVQGVSSLGIDVPAGITKVLGVMQLILGIMSAIQTILTVIGVQSSIPFFANGGLVRAAGGFQVPGNSFSGDRVPALLNSGELVLNRSQQGVLANALSGNAFDNLELTASLNGEDIVFAIDNASRRRGKGTMVRLRNS